MFTQVDPENLILETKKYEFSDGLRDIQVGFTFITMGIIFSWMFTPSWFQFLFKLKENIGKGALFISFLFLFLPALSAWGTEPIIRYLRRRWIWRNTGMVKPSRIMVPRHITVISGVVFLVVLALGFILEPILKSGDFYVFSLLFFAGGWSTGIMFIGLGRHYSVSRYIYTGLVGCLASSAILLYQTSIQGAVLTFFLGWGVILFVSGLFVLKVAWPDIKEASHAG